MAGRRDERYQSDLTFRLDRGEASLRNVSASGLYFITGANLTPGDSVKFDLEFSGEQIGRISARCEARVVRIEPQGDQIGVGATFDVIQFHRVAPDFS